MSIVGWSFTSSVVLVSIILFFVLAIVNKFANAMIPYNRWISWGAGILSFVAIAYIWALKPALVIGLLIGIAGGVLGGIFLGGTDSD